MVKVMVFRKDPLDWKLSGWKFSSEIKWADYLNKWVGKVPGEGVDWKVVL